MLFKVLSKVRVIATGQTGYVAFPYQEGEKIVVSINNGGDKLYDESELQYDLGAEQLFRLTTFRTVQN
ncbi:hypothetical protein [Desertivirga xinjiangensis]|uniref:hypothetical protein n=1 Tax=Desertivirga xinjiangensis TaxID=539206 RepID=UPI00210C14F5|nr:hypothetical protein [Pedobacter xinjiangensis]